MSKQILFGLFFAAPSLFVSSAVFLPVPARAADAAYASLVSEVNGVKVTATLQDTSAAAKTWNIQVTIETHTRPLSEQLETSAVLMADKKQHFAVAWQGTPPGGHHRTGVLVFNPIVPKPAAVELRILMNGESLPRGYTWRLK